MSHALAGIQWGNVPAWIGSVLTSSSLLIAAFGYRHSVAERTREQAARVSAWMVSSRQACVRNGNEVALVIRAFIVRPTDAASEAVSIAPGQTRRLSLPASYERTAVDEGQLALMPWILIDDSAGRSWLRSGDGGLERLSRDRRAKWEHRLDASTRLELTVD